MISFQAPLWLMLLALLPLIYWLHRFRQQSRTFPSTTLFLWQNNQHHKNSNGTLSRADPRWLLRALLTTLLILSLAEPGMQTKNRPSIEVWLDDSLSMFVHEEKQQRIQMSLQRLQHYLLESEPSAIQIHSLGNPAALLKLDPADSSGWSARLSEWTSRPRGEPLPPPPATLSPYNTHILLTDGADITLNEWAQSAPLQHAIQVGKKTHNIALSRLSLRRQLNDSDKIKTLIRVDNLAEIPQKARLILQYKNQIIEEKILNLPPSGKTIATFTIPANKYSGLHARVEDANDPLLLDNSLQLETDSLRPLLHYKMKMPDSCNPHIMAVLDSHPALIQDKEQVDVIIDCSGQLTEQSSEAERPTLRFHPAQSIQHTTQAAHWHKNLDMGALRMSAGLAYSSEAPALNAETILSANGRALILQQKKPTQAIDSYLDFSDPVFARQAEYPLLVLSLITRLTGQSLDKTPLTVARDINASRITPFTLAEIAVVPGETQTTETSFTSMLLLASLLVLLLDALLAAGVVAAVLRQFRKQDT